MTTKQCMETYQVKRSCKQNINRLLWEIHEQTAECSDSTTGKLFKFPKNEKSKRRNTVVLTTNDHTCICS